MQQPFHLIPPRDRGALFPFAESLDPVARPNGTTHRSPQPHLLGQRHPTNTSKLIETTPCRHLLGAAGGTQMRSIPGWQSTTPEFLKCTPGVAAGLIATFRTPGPVDAAAAPAQTGGWQLNQLPSQTSNLTAMDRFMAVRQRNSPSGPSLASVAGQLLDPGELEPGGPGWRSLGKTMPDPVIYGAVCCSGSEPPPHRECGARQACRQSWRRSLHPSRAGRIALNVASVPRISCAGADAPHRARIPPQPLAQGAGAGTGPSPPYSPPVLLLTFLAAAVNQS